MFFCYDRSEEFSDTVQKEYSESATFWATFGSVWMAKHFEMEKLELSENSWIELSWGKYHVINYEFHQFFKVCSPEPSPSFFSFKLLLARACFSLSWLPHFV